MWPYCYQRSVEINSTFSADLGDAKLDRYFIFMSIFWPLTRVKYWNLRTVRKHLILYTLGDFSCLWPIFFLIKLFMSTRIALWTGHVLLIINFLLNTIKYIRGWITYKNAFLYLLSVNCSSISSSLSNRLPQECLKVAHFSLVKIAV